MATRTSAASSPSSRARFAASSSIGRPCRVAVVMQRGGEPNGEVERRLGHRAGRWSRAASSPADSGSPPRRRRRRARRLCAASRARSTAVRASPMGTARQAWRARSDRARSSPARDASAVAAAACASSRRRGGSASYRCERNRACTNPNSGAPPGSGTTSPAASACSSDSSTVISDVPAAGASRSASNSDPNVAATSSRARGSRRRAVRRGGTADRRAMRSRPSAGHVGDEQRVAAGLGDDRLGVDRAPADQGGDILADRDRAAGRGQPPAIVRDRRAARSGRRRGRVRCRGVVTTTSSGWRPARRTRWRRHIAGRRCRPVEVLDDEEQWRRGAARRRASARWRRARGRAPTSSTDGCGGCPCGRWHRPAEARREATSASRGPRRGGRPISS